VNESKVVIGESALTALLRKCGKTVSTLMGPQQGNKLLLWESLSEEEKVKCWEILQQEKGWTI
jgi:hypothetical protein